MKIFLSLVLSVCTVIFLFAFSTQDNGTVKVTGGTISGTKSKDGEIRIFKGIPFAAPPVGDLRWKAPQPAQPWSGTKKCDAFAASPMQNKPAPFSMWTEEFLIPKEPISEDCLYLNVWTKATTAKEKRPVIVWVYGGGFSSGGSGCSIYDGEAMSKKGIVFVSINYRVGVFGFFAHPELTKESSNNASGNYGLMDQIAALQWVKKNIEAFGGDPDNVTIAGQSAGSMSVNCLVASPLAKGLFQRAIAESGASFVSSPFRGSTRLQQSEAAGVKVAASLNASSLKELRNITAEELLQKAQGTGPIVDGYVLPESIANIFAAGKQNDVPVLTGWNLDDGLLFGPLKNADEWKKQAEQQFGKDATTFLEYYPASTDAEAAASQYANSRDVIFGVQNYTWANMQTTTGKSNVYVYNFTRKVPATGEYVKYGAFHTGEVAYAYGNLKFLNNRPFVQEDYDLENAMSTYWANFAATGNPNSAGLPEWPIYNKNTSVVLLLGNTISAQKLPTKKALDFLYNEMKEK